MHRRVGHLMTQPLRGAGLQGCRKHTVKHVTKKVG
jgi:hypothetical protein